MQDLGEALNSSDALQAGVCVPIVRAKGLHSPGAHSGSVAGPGPEAQGVLKPSRWHCLSWESLSWRGDSGQEAQEAEVRISQGTGPQAERKPGARPGISNVFPPALARAPGCPFKALNQLSLPSFALILGPGKNADTAEATGFRPKGPDMVFKFSFLLQENFP